MGRRVQLIRGDTATEDARVGLQGEITIDTTKKEVRLHDGVIAGGTPVARADADNIQQANSTQDGKMSAAQALDLSTTSTQTTTNTADIAAIQAKDPVAAGVAEANKYLQLGGGKNVDTLEIAFNGLIIGGTTIVRTGNDINDLATRSGAETLVNKTLTAPVCNSPVLNTAISGSAIDTSVTTSTTKVPHSNAVKTYVDAVVSRGYIDATGSELSKSNTFTHAKIGTGHYRVTHNVGSNQYSLVANAQSGAYYARTVFGTNTCDVYIYNSAGTLVDSTWNYIFTA